MEYYNGSAGDIHGHMSNLEITSPLGNHCKPFLNY